MFRPSLSHVRNVLASLVAAALFLKLWNKLLALWRIRPKVLPSDKSIDHVIVFRCEASSWALRSIKNHLPKSLLKSPSLLKDLERWILTEIQRRGLVLTEQSAALWQLSASLRSESPKSPDESKAPLQAASEAPSFHVYSATVPFDVLCQYAEILHIQKEDVDGGFFPFTMAGAKKGQFKGFDQKDEFFTLIDKQAVVEHLLAQIKSEQGQRALLPLLEKEGLVMSYTPHNNELKAKVLDGVMRLPVPESALLAVAEYFGAEVGFYAAWLTYYAMWLLAAAVLGVITWFYIAADNALTAMLLYSVGISLWSTLFLEFWRQRSGVLGFKFHVVEDRYPLLLEPRPDFSGTVYRNEVTGLPDVYYPPWKRYLKYFVSAPICGLFLLLCWGCLTLSFWLQGVSERLTAQKFFASGVANLLVVHLPSIFYAITVPVLNPLYTAVAARLTEWENHRTQRDHNNAMIVKLFPFFFFNSYISLFYLAFVRQDVASLRQYVASLLVTSQIIGGVLEVSSVWLQGDCQRMSVCSGGQLGLPYLRGTFKIRAKIMKQMETAPGSGDELKAYEMEGQMEAFPGTFYEYVEMVIQFGYVVMFGWCWPWAPLCAFLNNLVEIRSDLSKICWSYRKPRLNHVSGIGKWFDVLQLLSLIGVVTSFTVMGMLLLFSDEMKPSATEDGTPREFCVLLPFDERAWRGTLQLLIGSTSWVNEDNEVWMQVVDGRACVRHWLMPSLGKVVLIGALQYGILFLKWLLSEVISDETHAVQVQRTRQEYLRRRVLQGLASGSPLSKESMDLLRGPLDEVASDKKAAEPEKSEQQKLVEQVVKDVMKREGLHRRKK